MFGAGRRYAIGVGLGLLLLVASCSKSSVPEDLALEVSPISVFFSEVKKGDTAVQVLTLSHVGGAGILRIREIYMKEGSSPDLSFEPPDKTELGPGESTQMRITYAPKDSSADKGVLVIEHNAPPNFKTEVPITAATQLAELETEPWPLDFGEVLGGTHKDMDVKLKNVGADSIVVKQAPYFAPDGSKDFSLFGDPVIPGGSGFPVELQPGDWLGLVLRYTPTGGDDDSTRLLVDTLAKGQSNIVSFNVSGTEVGPKLVAAPGQIDFGYVGLGETGEATVTVENHGRGSDPEVSMLVIPKGGIHLAESSDPNLVLVEEGGTGATAIPQTEWKLKAKDYEGYEDVPKSVTFTLSWTPTEAKPANDSPIGRVVIESNDETSSPTTIDVYGKVAAPYIAAMPTPVDFGFVGQKVTAKRTLTIINSGSGPLMFTAPLEVVDDPNGEFGVVQSAELKATSAAYDPNADCPAGEGDAPAGCVLEPGDSVEVELTFTNNGPASGSANARLLLKTNAANSPELTVDLVAMRAGTPTCEPVLEPAKLNFGIVPKGYSKDMMFKLRNKGTGVCSFKGARIENCTSIAGFIGQCSEPGTGAVSKTFVLVGMPPAVKGGLGPGQTQDLRVRFLSPANESIFAVLTNYTALLSANIIDEQTQEEIVIPEGKPGLGGNKTWEPNLIGDSGVAKISVLPAQVDFGVVTVGCYSKTNKVCVYNTGNAPLQVSSIALDGCTPEFKLKGVPPLPKDVVAGVPLCFDVVYGPQDTGPDKCQATVNSTASNGALVAVPLKGEGTQDDEQTDIFTQVSGQEVDVLFVIDDSGSMCDEQDKLVAAYDAFISHAKVWNNDYHIGVISVNVVAEPVIGKLNYGDKSKPRFLVPGMPPENFKEIADLGCDGGPYCSGFSGSCTDEQESGLQAAQVALSAPLITDTGVPCSSDQDCQNDTTICGDPKTCPYYCIEGTCSGYNKGFLRDNAQLEVIMMSDEEDQSPGPVSYYIDFFKNIKGYYNTNMMHVNAIVGPEPSGCGDPGGGGADGGKRYIQVAQETGGQVGEICSDDYSDILNDIGAQAFGLKVQFFLTRLADPPTIEVWVAGDKCEEGWIYDAPSNSIVFDENGPCMPDPGEEVKVHYMTVCLTE